MLKTQVIPRSLFILLPPLIRSAQKFKKVTFIPFALHPFPLSLIPFLHSFFIVSKKNALNSTGLTCSPCSIFDPKSQILFAPLFSLFSFPCYNAPIIILIEEYFYVL
jgi:hypothetical protein